MTSFNCINGFFEYIWGYPDSDVMERKLYFLTFLLNLSKLYKEIHIYKGGLSVVDKSKTMKYVLKLFNYISE